MTNMPYSLCLAGPGLDQVYLNSLVPGWNLTLSIQPTYDFLKRAGMATSTRETAIRLWENLPEGNDVELAKQLFKEENHGRTKYISGFQDASGIMLQGVTASWYDNSFMPKRIVRLQEPDILSWLEKHIELFEVGQRAKDFSLEEFADFNKYSAQRLADSAKNSFKAIKTKNLSLLGNSLNESRKAYQSVFPNSMPRIARQIAENLEEECYGLKPNGAGGGGYFICAIKESIGGIPIKVR